MRESSGINNSSQSHSRYFVAFQLQRAFRAMGFSQTQLGVLDALARWCRAAEDRMTPPQTSLAADAGISDRTVRSTLKDLVERGALLRDGAAYRFAPCVLGAYQLEVRACHAKVHPDRRAAAPLPNPDPRSAPDRIVDPPSSKEILEIPPTSSVATTGRQSVGNEKEDFRIKGQPLSEASDSQLRFIAFEATRARPMLKAAATRELERRASREDRDHRQAEWDRNAKKIAEAKLGEQLTAAERRLRYRWLREQPNIPFEQWREKAACAA